MITFGQQDYASGDFIPIEETEEAPFVSWESMPGEKYTLVMYDVAAPYPEDAYLSPYLHWIVKDIPDSTELIEYLPPSPPQESDNHTYVIDIYLQNGESRSRQHKRRENFNLQRFIETNRLNPEPIETFYFTTGYGAATEGSPIMNRHKDKYYLDVANLSEEEKKYCRCINEVSRKGTAYNPYAVCAATTGTTSRNCNQGINYDEVPDYELAAMIKRHQLPIVKPWNRRKAIEILRNKFD